MMFFLPAWTGKWWISESECWEFWACFRLPGAVAHVQIAGTVVYKMTSILVVDGSDNVLNLFNVRTETNNGRVFRTFVSNISVICRTNFDLFFFIFLLHVVVIEILRRHAVVIFTYILRAAFLPISFYKTNYKPEHKFTKLLKANLNFFFLILRPFYKAINSYKIRHL